MGKGMGKKKAGLVDAITDSADIVLGDKTRCGPCQNSMWITLISALVGAAILCFIFPHETYKPVPTSGAHMCPQNMFAPGRHYLALRDRFHFSKDEKDVEVCSYHPPNAVPSDKTPVNGNIPCAVVTTPCPKQKVKGLISFHWLLMMFSTLSAVPYFIAFIFYPGWAYKIHFRGGGAICCNTIPLTCGKVSSANDEQTHQADQMSRLLGTMIGTTFGLINFFTRMGVEKELIGDGLVAHCAVWTMLACYNLSSVWNKGSPRCYAFYQLTFNCALAGLMYMATGALDKTLDWSLSEEMAKTF